MRTPDLATVSFYQPQVELSSKVANFRGKYGDKMRVLEQPRESSSLGRLISSFDKNWEEKGLAKDWYNLRTKDEAKSIGFSMKKQMSLLENPYDKNAVAKWTQQTKQDLIGFKLEYLSEHLVYPCRYEKSASNPTRLENLQYDNKDILETTSDQERGGSVKDSLEAMKEFFLSDKTPDGSIAIMASPKGDTDLETDDGEAIRYPDSYFFIMQKDGDRVENLTLKTDFTLRESREAIYQLTGKMLSPTDSVEDYVKAVAKIKPGEHGKVRNASDVVGILETVRPSHAFENSETFEQTGWETVHKDVREASKLYDFNQKTQQAIADFEAFCLEGDHSALDLQKAIAATILRMSQLFYKEEGNSKDMGPEIWYKPDDNNGSFGDILEAVAARPGCAGGGSRFIPVDSIGGERMGVIVGGETKKTLKCKSCPQCGAMNIVATIEDGRIKCPNGCSAPYKC